MQRNVDVSSVIEAIAKRRTPNKRFGRDNYSAFRPSVTVNPQPLELAPVMRRQDEEVPSSGFGDAIGSVVNQLANYAGGKGYGANDDIVAIEQGLGRGNVSETAMSERLPNGETVTEAVARVSGNPALDKAYSDYQRYANKDYSKRKRRDAQGTVLLGEDGKPQYDYGADRDRSKSFMDVLKSAGLGALSSLGGNGSLKEQLGRAVGGAIAGGVAGGVDPSTDDRMLNDIKLQRAANAYRRELELEGEKEANLYRRKQRENIETDNQLNQKRYELAVADYDRKLGDRDSREKTSRMNAVAGMFKSLPSYDPNDPKFAELTAALGDVKLPVTPKDAKKKVDLKQDQRTGAWTVILTDPVSGKQEVRNVIKDGKPFVSTPTVVMQGEYGMLKQNDQQAFQAGENEKNRDQRREEFVKEYQLKVQREIANIGNDMQKAAQWKQAEIRKIEQAVKDGKLDRSTADIMLQGLQ